MIEQKSTDEARIPTMILEVDDCISNLFDLADPIQAFQATRLQKGRYWEQRQKIRAVKKDPGTIALDASEFSGSHSPKLSSVFDYSDSGSLAGFSQISSTTLSSKVLGSSKADFQKRTPASTPKHVSWADIPTPKSVRLPPRFVYEPLPNKQRSMRLLKLFASSPHNPEIECQLVVVGINARYAVSLLFSPFFNWEFQCPLLMSGEFLIRQR